MADPPSPSELVLGVDGGGTKTVAWIGVLDSAVVVPLGRGLAGPSNPQGLGFDAALENLGRAVDAAFADAGLPLRPVAGAALALAGSDRDENRRIFGQWAERRRLAKRYEIVHDGWAVLAAGAPQGWGIALIAGTGSFCFGRAADGQTCRAGGWGYLFGDEGSAWSIAIAGLRAAAQSADGREGPTALVQGFLERLKVQRPEQLILPVYALAADRAAVAAMADVVFAAFASGDATAERILRQAAAELGAAVGAVARRLALPAEFPLSLAGGVLLRSEILQQWIAEQLGAAGLSPQPLSRVLEPVSGALVLARSLASGLWGGVDSRSRSR